ncbi:YgdI/YgdR family lipoprotein [Pseudarthrobacter sp. NS4]|uniref:YgdI/YgdR family lipoprotein n=1 Tax=Pseudarthrobacter sp. NS4 TaxID=2973976 RepID=UPI002161FA8B|nr:YgdI/YgdR family lipoprotein [Pseudarthrobacter sp. NS4]
MKKFATALFAAGLVLSATACSTSQQLSTAETCERIQTVVSNPANSAGKTGMNRLANQIRPIHAVASDDLKPALESILEYTDEQAKETPDEAKLAELQADYEQAGNTYSRFCS